MASSNNPIELLIQLAVNNQASRKNIDSNIKELKNYYDKNPLLLSLDIDKTKALKNVNDFIKQVGAKNIELGVSLKGNVGSEIAKMKNSAQDLTREFTTLNQVMNRAGGSSTRSFNIDLDRVLIQLDNLARKGVVAKGQIDGFSNSIKALKDTNDRLTLKEIVKDIFNVTSSATHADKAMQLLTKTLNSTAQAQQKLEGFKDKFGINPSTNDEYQRLTMNIERLTSDLIKLQSQVSTGGADQVKLAGQIRDTRSALAEATREISNFGKTAKSDLSLTSAIAQANNLYESLRRTGKIDSGTLSSFRAEITSIGNSSESSTAKVQKIVQAMEKMRAESSRTSTDKSFEDSMQRQQLALDRLEAKLVRIGQIHKSTVDKMKYKELTRSLLDLNQATRQATDQNQLNGLIDRYRTLAGSVDILGANATTASRASQGLGGALSQALQKFPVWMFSATVFYAPIRGLQDLTEKVIELDRNLIQLQRVNIIAPHSSDAMLNTEYAGKSLEHLIVV